jgi:hypothetical protein
MVRLRRDKRQPLELRAARTRQCSPRVVPHVVTSVDGRRQDGGKGTEGRRRRTAAPPLCLVLRLQRCRDYSCAQPADCSLSASEDHVSPPCSAQPRPSLHTTSTRLPLLLPTTAPTSRTSLRTSSATWGSLPASVSLDPAGAAARADPAPLRRGSSPHDSHDRGRALRQASGRARGQGEEGEGCVGRGGAGRVGGRAPRYRSIWILTP